MADTYLEKMHPELVPSEPDLARIRALLQPAFEDYIEHVSPDQMTIGGPTAVYIYWLCEQTQPRRVADFGSGFTSYVLRKYAQDNAEFVQFDSVDDKAEWLHWTEKFLERQAVGTAGLWVWDNYRAAPLHPTYDLIVYDFGGGDFREDNMGFALDRLAADGAIVFDDAQHHTHQPRMLAECRARRYELFDLGEWTRDRFGRFAALGVKWT